VNAVEINSRFGDSSSRRENRRKKTLLHSPLESVKKLITACA